MSGTEKARIMCLYVAHNPSFFNPYSNLDFSPSSSSLSAGFSLMAISLPVCSSILENFQTRRLRSK